MDVWVVIFRATFQSLAWCMIVCALANADHVLHTDLLSTDFVKRLLSTVCTFLRSKTREVVRSTLEFIKVTIGVLLPDELLSHLEELVRLRTMCLVFWTFIYRIAGYFRGTKFSQIDLEPRKFSASKSLFTVGLWSIEPLLKNKIPEMFSLSNLWKFSASEITRYTCEVKSEHVFIWSIVSRLSFTLE